MTFCSLLRMTLIAGSFCACVGQYTSPGPEVESTSTESKSDSARESSEAAKPSETNDAPTEASGACDDRTCTYTTDCCGGYECGFDPGRSRVMRYCLAN